MKLTAGCKKEMLEYSIVRDKFSEVLKSSDFISVIQYTAGITGTSSITLDLCVTNGNTVLITPEIVGTH